MYRIGLYQSVDCNVWDFFFGYGRLYEDRLIRVRSWMQYRTYKYTPATYYLYKSVYGLFRLVVCLIPLLGHVVSITWVLWRYVKGFFIVFNKYILPIPK